MKTLIFAAIPLVLVGCKRTDKHSNQSPEQAAKPTPVVPSQIEPQQSRAAEPEDVVDPAAITWSTHTIDDLGVEIPQIEGLRLLELPMGGARSWQQHKKPIATAVWAGPGRTIEAWRERLSKGRDNTLGKASTMSVCGVQGIRQEASMKGHPVPVGNFAAGKAQLKALVGRDAVGDKPSRPRSEYTEVNGRRFWQLPDRTTVVLAFEHKGTPIVAAWTVEGNNREAFAAAEKHFFNLIRCSD